MKPWKVAGVVALVVLVALGGLLLSHRIVQGGHSGNRATLAVQTSSVALNESGPYVYGQRVSYTAVYPSTARKKIGKQQQVQPQINTYCYQAGVLVFAVFWGGFPETNLGSGWWSQDVGPLTLGGRSYGELDWTGGAADCTVLLGYYVKDVSGTPVFNLLASAGFQVGA